MVITLLDLTIAISTQVRRQKNNKSERNLQNHPRILCYHPPLEALSSLTLFCLSSSPPVPFARTWLFSFLQSPEHP